MDKQNLTMLTDFYELTMTNGYIENNLKDKISYFDMFFRRVPDDGGFAIVAGVEQLIQYLKNLKFSNSDIEYLKSKKIFNRDF
jgi:nicotinate phosphoribosyltransferase